MIVFEKLATEPSGKFRIKIRRWLSITLKGRKVDTKMDKDIQKLILEVSKFDEEDRKNIFSVIEAFVAKRKIQSIL